MRGFLRVHRQDGFLYGWEFVSILLPELLRQRFDGMRNGFSSRIQQAHMFHVKLVCKQIGIGLNCFSLSYIPN